jgi:hypothetical protein|tara:strand:- start:41 stop:214 length:174 start_codon:yes stop_codon:yes gene_type:complete
MAPISWAWELAMAPWELAMVLWELAMVPWELAMAAISWPRELGLAHRNINEIPSSLR